MDIDAQTFEADVHALSRFGLGMAALGRPGYINLAHGDDLQHDYGVDAMRAHAWNVLDAAYAAGIRYVDVARSYGRAEEFLAGWIANRSVERIAVGSKWGYTYTADWSVTADDHEVKDHTLSTLRRQWSETFAELGPWLTFYQIHSATESSGALDRGDVLDELARLREMHQVGIGLTVSGLDSRRTIERALPITRNGERLFSFVQATWNLLEPSLSDILDIAHSQGVHVIVKEAVANGRLTDRNNDPSFTRTRGILEQEAGRLGCTIDQLALAAVLDQPWVDHVLSGAATVEHVHSNIGAADIQLDDEARSALASIAETPESYWATRSALDWN